MRLKMLIVAFHFSFPNAHVLWAFLFFLPCISYIKGIASEHMHHTPYVYIQFVGS